MWLVRILAPFNARSPWYPSGAPSSHFGLERNHQLSIADRELTLCYKPRSRVLHKDRALLPSRCRGSPLIFTYCAFAQPSCCGHVLVSTSKATFGQLCDRLFWRRRCQAPRLPLPSLFSKARVTKLFHTRAREWLALLPMAHGKTNSARSLLKEKRMAHLQYASANILEICMTVCMSNPVAHMIGNAARI